MTFGASDNYGIPTCDEGKCLVKIKLNILSLPLIPETSFKLMDRYREFGGNFLDTADVYGPYNSEKIGKFFSREKIIRDLHFSWQLG